MFEQLEPARPDPILALVSEFRGDPRENKIDLSSGVYRDESGNTPVVAAVQQAEQLVLEQQTTKVYLGLTGNARFNDHMARLVLGHEFDLDRVARAQATGGSGALRLLGELARLEVNNPAIWLSEPTWPNHNALFTATGIECRNYPYFDGANQRVDFDAMCDAVRSMPAGDIIVLHGCCHNPTGCDLTSGQWQTLAALIENRGLVPLVDIAYHGLGRGLDEDVAGVKELVGTVPMAMIAVSCSKNFGLYRDRVGCAMVTTRSVELAARLTGHLGVAGRRLYSMPPDHGAAVVSRILENHPLTKNWMSELDGMRGRINGLRKQLAEKMNMLSGTRDWDFLAQQYGMFSLLGLDSSQLARLKNEHAIYAVRGGRINFAGMHENGLDTIAAALLEVRGTT